MAKAQKIFACQACGMTHSKWKGKCDGCNEWNTLEEEILSAPLPKSLTPAAPNRAKLESLDPSNTDEHLQRYVTPITELNRVLGGGLVPGSLVLMGGEPGIGKSTLLLQLLGALGTVSQISVPCGYFTGEEGVQQIQQRACRLGIDTKKALVKVANIANLESLLEVLTNNTDLQVVVIDSIQTMFTSAISSAPGTVAQIRQCTAELMQLAKSANICIILVGHVTKEGTLAGPRLLEHMVDTVLYFEGDRSHTFRLLRGVKNRFGPTHELGVFQMTQRGLEGVDNPSKLFLPQRDHQVTGSCVFAGLEGTRPLLVEIEALVAQASYPNPRRAVVGWDQNRLAMILAVLESRVEINLNNKDVYLNIVGGLKLNDPAADLAVAMALTSALFDKPLPDDAIFLGEIGLSGELRPVRHAELRCQEARRLGFPLAFGSVSNLKNKPKDFKTKPFDNLKQAITFFFQP